MVNTEPSSSASTVAVTSMEAVALGAIVPASHVVPSYVPSPIAETSVSPTGSGSSSVTSSSVTSPVLVASSVNTMVSPTLGESSSTDFASDISGDEIKINAISESGVGSNGSELSYIAAFSRNSPSTPVRTTVT